ncbi:MAG: sugar porter family MFS transporter [Bacteroidales bacterium]|nr:sugar porter family MFS transporter [Bacteroidales bacterium]
MTASYNKRFIYFICLVSAMGGLLFGYDWVVIGGAVKFYEQFFGLGGNPVLQGIATSAALVGCMFGALTAGALADRYGRKPLLILAAVLFTVSAVATGVFNVFGWFCLARLVGGVGIGLASAISPMYIAEVSPAEVRGRLVSLNQMTIVLGILAAQIANWAIARPDVGGQIDPWNITMGWRWMFWAETVPAAAFLVMAFFIPESPRWLALNGRRGVSRSILSRIGGLEYAEGELAGIAASVANAPAQKAGLKDLFCKRYARLLVLGVIIAVFQQWCGTNVIFIYAQDVFAGAGYSVSEAFLNIIVTGIANVVFTILALQVVDRWGRRSLMLLGSGGLALIYLVLGLCFRAGVTGIVMVLLTVAAIACYALTLAPVTWVLLSEIFPNRVRGIAMAVCTFALWVGSCTLTFAFPSMNAALGCSGSFLIYAAICLCGFLYFLKACPETKGKSLEQLENEL